MKTCIFYKLIYDSRQRHEVAGDQMSYFIKTDYMMGRAENMGSIEKEGKI